ncbi:MAG: hypothetical protein HY738_15765 [Bacteroidia bacterium]|nr:hypothetical protein [Bacteroidia bacterium]
MKQFIILIDSRLNVWLICLTLVLGIIFCSCNKDHCSSISRIPAEMKSWVMFPEGSYWIYRDSTTGVLDSVILKHQEIKIIQEDESHRCYEVLDHDFYSTNNIINSGSCAYFDYVYSCGLGHYFVGIVGESIDFYNLKYIAYFDSLYINNILYQEVKCFRTFSSNVHKNTQSYWAKNIGIIKSIKLSPSGIDTLNIFELQ